jgi:hypothetical protein
MSDVTPPFTVNYPASRLVGDTVFSAKCRLRHPLSCQLSHFNHLFIGDGVSNFSPSVWIVNGGAA